MARLFALLLLLALLAGCARFAKLRDDLEDYDANVGRLTGTIVSDTCTDCPVLLVPLDAEGRPLSYKVFEGPGRFEILFNKAARSVFAFHDYDGDMQYDAGEPFAWQPLAPDATGPVTLHVRAADAQPAPAMRPQGSLFPMRNRLIGGVDIQLGTVAPLSDERFDRDNARLGMWQPVGFMREGLAGIYFLEPYSPDKTPVLLVHGIGGTPRDFEPLLQGLDREHYQPWLFYYPSGLELSALGTGLVGMLNELWRQHRFRELHVVAHSMGGLVARSFINECRKQDEFGWLRTFTSISSPFGGASAAQAGVDHAPVVMPVWRDMSPQSRFLGELFASPPPVQVQHHLVFGYRDRTVPLHSQLPLAAQQQAASMRGFDDDHTGILAEPEVAQHINAVLGGQLGPH
jgi:pimeloyl-ACP methyl ester carboxylesterase